MSERTDLASHSHRDLRRAGGWPGWIARWLALALGAAISTAFAEPLELRQGGEVGAGTGFRRGDVCLVLTAAHVVKEPGITVTALDRSGARATGQVTYSNPAYDIALVTLQPGFAVACHDRWPDAAWMSSVRWSSSSMLEAQRHYPDGRQSVILLRWAGGTGDTLTLARTDRMEIRSTDSGAVVVQGDRVAGIIKSVDTSIDRVEVVRFDVIDRLVGDRFRGAAINTVTFDGVFWRGRPHPNWTSYASGWLTESARKSLVDSAHPQSRCRIRADVVDWSQHSAENPKYTELRQGLASCRANVLSRVSPTAIKLCEDGYRAQLKDTPRQQRVHSIQLKLDMTPRNGSTQSRLRSFERAADSAPGSRAKSELELLQASFGEVATEMLASGVCD
jgi:hypothetical protein